MSAEGLYTPTADAQLDKPQDGADMDLYNSALDTCELVFQAPGIAQSRSTAIPTTEGIRFRLPIARHPPYRVFWSRAQDGPRIEAVFPHP